MSVRFVRTAMLCSVVAMSAVQVGAAPAPTGTEAIAARQHLMKRQGGDLKVLIDMIRGKAPYDGAKASAALRALAITSAEIPDLFPADSKTGHKTRALPAIWENKADFDAKAHKLHQDAIAAEGPGGESLVSLKAAFSTVSDGCNACHDKYRRREH